MKVLVIGSGGYMGRHLISGLVSRGIEALGVSSGDGSGIDPESGLFPNDFSVPQATRTVVYMAQSPRYLQVPEYASHVLAVNTLSAVRAATAARKAGVDRFIYVSTGTVYAPTFAPIPETGPVRRDNWYVLSKLHGEEALALFRPDMEIIVVRPFGVYGPGQTGRLVPNLLASVKEHRAITLQPRADGADDQDGLRISLCYIDDATNILISLAQKGGPDCLNLAGPEALSIRSLAEALARATGCSPIFQMSSTARDSDLIADTSLLVGALAPKFTMFRDGIANVISP